MKQIRINAIVSQELFDFAQSQNRGNKSYVVREALECFRLARQIWGANWLEEMKAIEARKRLVR